MPLHDAGELPLEPLGVTGPANTDAQLTQASGKTRRPWLAKPQRLDLVRVRGDLLWRSLKRDATAPHHDDPVGLEGFLHEVGDVDNGPAVCLEPAHHLED